MVDDGHANKFEVVEIGQLADELIEVCEDLVR